MGDILIFGELKNNAPKKVAFELVGKASQLAPQIGGKVVVALLTTDDNDFAKGFGAYGADKVVILKNAAFSAYNTEIFSDALVKLIGEISPSAVLIGATVLGKDLAPRVAAALNVGLAPDCVEINAADGKLVAKRPVYAGKALTDVVISSTPQVITIRPNVLGLVNTTDKAAELVAKEISVIEPKAKLVEIVEPETKRPDVTEADRIVSGGRGMKSKEEFFQLLEPLADVLGAAIGASRAAVDSGFAEQALQVGQTGKVVNPTLYMAFGISGAIQHLAGMRNSKFIVAVNKDPEAPIFSFADFGVVDDLFKVVPILTEELRKEVGK